MKVFILKKVSIERYANADRLAQRYKKFFKLGGVFEISAEKVVAMTVTKDKREDICILRGMDAVGETSVSAVPLPEDAPLREEIDFTSGLIFHKNVRDALAGIYHLNDGDIMFPDREFKEFVESRWFGRKDVSACDGDDCN